MTAIENGYSGISLQKIIAVSQVLHVSLDVLTGLEEQKRENAIEKVIPLLKDCSANQIALIADIIKAVKRNPL